MSNRAARRKITGGKRPKSFSPLTPFLVVLCTALLGLGVFAISGDPTRPASVPATSTFLLGDQPPPPLSPRSVRPHVQAAQALTPVRIAALPRRTQGDGPVVPLWDFTSLPNDEQPAAPTNGPPAAQLASGTSGTGTPNEFLYGGQQWDAASGTYYLRARYYDPTAGRFLSQDPDPGHLSDPASLHRYVYGIDDPVNHDDPTGKSDGLLGSLTAIGGAFVVVADEDPEVFNALNNATNVADAQTLNAATEAAPLETQTVEDLQQAGTTAAEDGTPQLVQSSQLGEVVDAGETMSARAAAYQQQITGLAQGQVYRLSGVKFDGYRNGILLDAEGPGYARFIAPNGQFQPWFRGGDALVAEAERQVAVATGRAIEWHIAEADAVPTIRTLLQENGISNITIVYTPPTGPP